MNEATSEQRVFKIGGLNLPTARGGVAQARAHVRPDVHTVIDRNGRQHACAVFNRRLEWVEDPYQERTRYRYDDFGRLVARRDAMRRTTHYAYDGAGRLDAVGYIDGSVLRHAYDDRGRLISRELPNGANMQFDYAADRLASVTFAEDDGFALSYDEQGQLSEVADTGCETSYTYHPQGRVAAVTRCIDGVTFTLRYSQEGHAVALELPHAETVDLQTPAAKAQEKVAHSELRFDQMANVVASKKATFVYDACDQLIEAQDSSYGVLRYEYDGVGNRLVRKEAKGKTRYTYDQRDRLTRIERADGSVVQLGYDAQGNLTRKTDGATTWQYDYNRRQQLACIRRDGRVVSRYRYDCGGRRIWRQVGQETTLYHYDLIGRVVALTRTDGRPFATFAYEQGRTVARRYHASGDIETLYLHTDHLGSTQRITDVTGNLVWQAAYTPFGRLLSEPPDFDCPLFTGQLWDAESGLYYFGARYYDPELGRFISPDPWTCGPDDPRIMGQPNGTAVLPQAWLTQPRAAHPYLYCLNNPVTYRDPEGLGWGAAVGYFFLFLLWSLPWTLLGLALTLVDWVFQYPLFGWKYLPKYGLDGISSLRLGSFAWVNIGGLLNFPMVLATATFTRRGFVDQLSEEREEYIVPLEAHRTPRELRPARTAYFEKILRHTVQTHWWGPFWPFAYLFGSNFWEKDAARQSGFSRIAEPVLTVTPDKFYARSGCHLIVLGGDDPFTGSVSNEHAGSVESVAGTAGAFEPGVLFELADAGGAHQTSLDGGTVPSDLRTAFQNSGVNLPPAPDPSVTQEQAGSHWQITHDAIIYNIHRRNNMLFVDSARFHEALFKPTYRPDKYTITVRDQASLSDERDIKIVRLKVKKVKKVAPGHLILDDLSEPERPTMRLVDRQAGTVEINIKPNKGTMFFEAVDLHPTIAGQTALQLSRTSSTGDARLTITPRSAPVRAGMQFDVAGAAAAQPDLDAGNTPAALWQAFRNAGIAPAAAPAPAANVQQAGGHWQVTHDGVVYDVRWPDIVVTDGNGFNVAYLDRTAHADLQANHHGSANLQAQLRNEGFANPPTAVATVHANAEWTLTIGGQALTARRQNRLYVSTDAGATPQDYSVHVRPWDGQRLFRINFTAALQNALDTNLNPPNNVRVIFQNNGAELSPDAVVLVVRASDEWQVLDHDNDQAFTVRHEGADLNVYPALKWLQVRSLAWITIKLQAHIVRDDNGLNPAADNDRLNSLVARANEIWRQAGIRYEWRTQRQYIDEEDYLTITYKYRLAGGAADPAHPDEDEDMYRWRPNPPGPWTAASGQNHHRRDEKAIHVYFINSFDQPANSNVLAFAGFRRNYLVMPRAADGDDFAHELGHNLELDHPDNLPSPLHPANAPAPPNADKRVMYSFSATFEGQRFLIANHEPSREQRGGGVLPAGNTSSNETATARSQAVRRVGP